MSFEDYLNSDNQLGELAHGNASLLESLASCLSFNNVDHSLAENLSASIARMANLHANLVYGNTSTINSSQFAHSGSSSLTDATSPQAGGGYGQRSGIANTDSSYLNLPNSPLSFSSNHLSSPSSIDGSSIAQPFSPRRGLNNQLGQRRLIGYQVDGTASHQLGSQSRVPGKREDYANTRSSKRPRLGTSSENILHQQISPELLQDQDYNRKLRALMQEYMLKSQQQGLPRHLGISAQQPQRPQVRHYMQQQQPMQYHQQEQATHHSSNTISQDSGLCSRRLMQYLYHLQHRPSENSLAYWRKFVAEYYAPGAKEKWCLSVCDSIGEHATGVFSQKAWHCSLCGSKSGKGFEAVFEILPRLCKMKFESGVIDEILFLECPYECRFASGLMMLSYGKVVLESVYEQFRVIREGQLRIFFNHELKIMSWEFCSRHHEEFVPRRLVAPQVHQLVQAAEKYQTSVKDNGPDGASPQDLQSNCNMFVAAGQQLTRNLQLLLVNDLGFPKRYVRCLQVADVVSSLKDLMTFSVRNNIGPIESLRRYARREETVDNQTIRTLGRGGERAASADRPSGSMKEKSCTTSRGPRGTHKAASKSHHKVPKGKSPNSSLAANAPNPPHQQMVGRLLREMVANSRARGTNREAQVKQELLDEFIQTATGNAEAKSTSSSSGGAAVKTEPVTFEDINTRLPEAVRDMDYEFFSNGILSDDWNEVDWNAV